MQILRHLELHMWNTYMNKRLSKQSLREVSIFKSKLFRYAVLIFLTLQAPIRAPFSCLACMMGALDMKAWLCPVQTATALQYVHQQIAFSALTTIDWQTWMSSSSLSALSYSPWASQPAFCGVINSQGNRTASGPYSPDKTLQMCYLGGPGDCVFSPGNAWADMVSGNTLDYDSPCDSTISVFPSWSRALWHKESL